MAVEGKTREAGRYRGSACFIQSHDSCLLCCLLRSALTILKVVVVVVLGLSFFFLFFPFSLDHKELKNSDPDH